MGPSTVIRSLHLNFCYRLLMMCFRQWTTAHCRSKETEVCVTGMYVHVVCTWILDLEHLNVIWGSFGPLLLELSLNTKMARRRGIGIKFVLLPCM